MDAPARLEGSVTLAGRISRLRNLRMRRWRTRARFDLRRRGIRNSNPLVHGKVLLSAPRTIALSCVFVAKAGQFVAAVDAIAVSGGGSSLDGYKGHRMKFLNCGY